MQLPVAACEQEAKLPVRTFGNLQVAGDPGELASGEADQVERHCVVEPELVPGLFGGDGVGIFVEPDLLHRDQHAGIAHRNIRGRIDVDRGVAPGKNETHRQKQDARERGGAPCLQVEDRHGQA